MNQNTAVRTGAEYNDQVFLDYLSQPAPSPLPNTYYQYRERDVKWQTVLLWHEKNKQYLPSCKHIAELLNVKYSSITNFFTARHIPSLKSVEKVEDFFITFYDYPHDFSELARNPAGSVVEAEDEVAIEEAFQSFQAAVKKVKLATAA